jgi:chemotaxis receptor (MCP) glutamine deamidase CheD
MKILLIVIVTSVLGYCVADVVTNDAYGKCRLNHFDSTCVELLR